MMATLNAVSIEPGTEIFAFGQPGDSAYVIESGSVEVLDGPLNALRRIKILGCGALIGEIALLDGKTRTATVRALEPTQLIPVRREHLDALLRGTDPIVRQILDGLLSKLRDYVQVQPDITDRHADEETVGFGDLVLAEMLSEAIDGHQLDVHYQPIVSSHNGILVGVEALMRWQHPTLGNISPARFIPLAMKTGLIHRVGDLALRQALSDWPTIRPLCMADPQQSPFVSVNMTAPEISEPGFAGRISNLLVAMSCNPAELRIEITENALIENSPSMVGAIDHLRSIGVGLAIDDYGQGYAGLHALLEFPFTSLKIDKIFIDRMLASTRSEAIIKSTLALARELGMSTIAEGIEDARTSEKLVALGCSYTQGFFVSPPMPLTELTGWRSDKPALAESAPLFPNPESHPTSRWKS